MKAIFLKRMAVCAGIALAGCTSMGPQPSEVTRFHLNQPIARAPIAIEPLGGGNARDLEFRAYADAVARQLSSQGWTVVDARDSEQVALIGFGQQRFAGAPRSPVSVGIGGSTGGWSSGVGGGISFPIGKRNGEMVESSMAVRIQRRSDSTVVWEGRARTTAGSNAPEASPAAAADKLASALFQGFPGESGRTITVK